MLVQTYFNLKDMESEFAQIYPSLELSQVPNDSKFEKQNVAEMGGYSVSEKNALRFRAKNKNDPDGDQVDLFLVLFDNKSYNGETEDYGRVF